MPQVSSPSHVSSVRWKLKVMTANASPDPKHEAAPAPQMNYQCNPDLDPKQDLTVDAVSLFQRFRQAEDVAAIDVLLDHEFARHIKLCELNRAT